MEAREICQKEALCMKRHREQLPLRRCILYQKNLEINKGLPEEIKYQFQKDKATKHQHLESHCSFVEEFFI